MLLINFYGMRIANVKAVAGSPLTSLSGLKFLLNLYKWNINEN